MNATSTAHALNLAVAGRDHAAAEEAKAKQRWRTAQAKSEQAQRDADAERTYYQLACNATNRAAERLEQARTQNQQTDTR